jgi:hypothetical protein
VREDLACHANIEKRLYPRRDKEMEPFFEVPVFAPGFHSIRSSNIGPLYLSGIRIHGLFDGLSGKIAV